MKIVRDFTSEKDAVSFAHKLRERGIPTHIGVFKGSNFHIYTSDGPKTYGVWVLEDSQYNDAVRLIKGGKHKVKNPLSEEQIAHLEAELTRKNIHVILRDMAIFSLGLGILIFFLIDLWKSNA